MAKNIIFPRAVLFDLLTALLNTWTVWNAVERFRHGWRGVARRVSAPDLWLRRLRALRASWCVRRRIPRASPTQRPMP